MFEGEAGFASDCTTISSSSPGVVHPWQSYRKVIPPPRLVDQHAFRIELDTLFRKQLELLLDVLPTRGLLPVTLEAANELNVIVSPALLKRHQRSSTYPGTSNASMTRHFRREGIVS